MTTRRRLAPRGDASGFTLVELLVVLVVTGLLAAIVAPTLLRSRRAAYEASAKSDVKNIAKEITAELVDSGGPFELSGSDGVWTLSREGSPVATGELSPHNELSGDSFVAADGSYCLSVRNSRVDARSWSADEAGLRPGDCGP